ncbi:MULTISPECIES: antA/AntB antirepressor family protein [unclassified Psychrobacter]|uniref:antA/AntB antirepressor family protein n=1 Tax=unclassified Psychrobacter TaxID=196806 RepID=UPI0018F657E8|nr:MULTISPECIES: antA/AntB antirepressor family protein [unclassified Psychrobacter]
MQLPTIQENKELQQAVSARELFAFLEVKDRFSVWIERMIGYGFVESQDYLGCRLYDTRANQELQDFAISVDMAKEISMIQRSDKGRQARQYFIECERKVINANQSATALPDFTNPADAAIAWAAQYKATEEAQAKLAAAQPKIIALQTISNSEGATGIRDTAKAVGMKQNEFVAWCIDEEKPVNRRFMYRNDRGVLNAYSHRTSAGLMTQKLHAFIGRDGRDRAEPRVKFTPAGVAKIAEMLAAEGVTSGTEAV